MFKDDVFLSGSEKRSYEYNRAQTLKAYMEKTEVLLDIHASATLESEVFAICEDNASDISRYLPVDLVVSGFDSVEPGGTDYYMNKIGKVGVCVECGYLGDELSTEIAKESILSFLALREHIDSQISERTQQKINMNRLYHTKTDSFVLTRNFKDFEKINEGELIGVDGTEKIFAKNNSVILFARNRNKPGEEAFLLGEIFK
jgi:succinylglutamate desuccinylase